MPIEPVSENQQTLILFIINRLEIMQRVKLIQVISRQHDVKNVQKVLFSGLDLFGRSALKGG
jgi:hypothetical protein